MSAVMGGALGVMISALHQVLVASTWPPTCLQEEGRSQVASRPCSKYLYLVVLAN
jgi:hypothetical protein